MRVQLELSNSLLVVHGDAEMIAIVARNLPNGETAIGDVKEPLRSCLPSPFFLLTLTLRHTLSLS